MDREADRRAIYVGEEEKNLHKLVHHAKFYARELNETERRNCRATRTCLKTQEGNQGTSPEVAIGSEVVVQTEDKHPPELSTTTTQREGWEVVV